MIGCLIQNNKNDHDDEGDDADISLLLQLIVNLVDMNDNVPMFSLSQYIVQGIAETVAVGTDIIQGQSSRLNTR